MVKSNAERNLSKNKLKSEQMKQKSRIRDNQRRRNLIERFNNQQSTTYKSRQSLPKDPSKRVDVTQHIAQVLNVIPTTTKHHKREQRSLSTALEELVIKFYYRGDVSYQMPSKRDCITVDDDGKKITLQKSSSSRYVNEANLLLK
ncbi:unnamed protein product [Rotaria magnacalcarata]|uniref:Uncharacterized protein n=2 Tax=Rotaria TaxID=231623 RepID=A0A819R512_9BILA|nr:unnamed protein product [Rotaria magnacalcarata]CAF1598296.1 unnamed protein product [Rotaria magnacalcarata]CAF2052472.1 unnamed protein product [Rotaria magnacalcarata]CAF2089782.1 unnamed protein product [Rotaria magnacalcarata]CAF3802959.1 unnamed protein product [Rotaria magnacalcarata]